MFVNFFQFRDIKDENILVSLDTMQVDSIAPYFASVDLCLFVSGYNVFTCSFILYYVLHLLLLLLLHLLLLLLLLLEGEVDRLWFELPHNWEGGVPQV